jgi:hypothetical protein
MAAFRIPWNCHRPLHSSPFRAGDHTPSFSIFNRGKAFKDHGCGGETKGDQYVFFQLATKLDAKAAFRPFIELAGLRLPEIVINFLMASQPSFFWRLLAKHFGPKNLFE